MVIRRPGSSRFFSILIWILLLWLGVLLAGFPHQVQADSNDPTATLTPTATIAVTLPPTDTPIPTSEPSQEDAAAQEDTIAKGVGTSELENAAPASLDESGPKPLTSSLGLIDLVLIGAIVVVAIAVMVLVVNGIIQRLG